MAGSAALAADILTDAVFQKDGLARYDTRDASIVAYGRALQKAGFNYDEVAEQLAGFPQLWKRR